MAALIAWTAPPEGGLENRSQHCRHADAFRVREGEPPSAAVILSEPVAVEHQCAAVDRPYPKVCKLFAVPEGMCPTRARVLWSRAKVARNNAPAPSRVKYVERRRSKPPGSTVSGMRRGLLITSSASSSTLLPE
jgi:hypothetical protein